MAKALKVKATKNGYRRAGFGFSSDQETVLFVDQLKEEQIEALKGDANLIVVEADVQAEKATKTNKDGADK